MFPRLITSRTWRVHGEKKIKIVYKKKVDMKRKENKRTRVKIEVDETKMADRHLPAKSETLASDS